MSDASVVCSNLSFSWPDDTPVFTGLAFAVGPGRTGLVAPNGAGKSTLLRLIAGELRPASGGITVTGQLGYLAQHLPLAGGTSTAVAPVSPTAADDPTLADGLTGADDLTVADVLGIAPVIDALRALEAGDAREEHFTTIGGDWDIEDRTRAELGRLGLGDIPFDRPLRTLSGGQIVTLGLAAHLIRRPDVLLLDEPTNNLDLAARHRLHALVEGFTGCLLLVSHDRALLDRMDRIVELDRGEIHSYGGNFTAYEEAVSAQRAAAERDVRSAELELRREKREKQLARERAARRAGNAARTLSDAGLPKIVAGAMKRRAQESAGRAQDIHAGRVGQARARLGQAEEALRDDQPIVVDLPATTVPAGRTLFVGERMQVRLGGRDVFAPGGVDLTIRGPERIALTGPNGAGKTTLLRLIAGILSPTAGQVRAAVEGRVAGARAGSKAGAGGRVAYLSQRLDLLDLHRTVAENLADRAPEMPLAERMTLLARYRFRGEAADRPVGLLSGGERLRATLAGVLHADPAPHLLLLDEPTNNLDLPSLTQLQSALNAYRGAFITISHDKRFLQRIGVNRWLHLDNGRLTPATRPDPAEPA